MNRGNLHIDLIERYLDKSLEADELALFNEMLENNDQFVKDLKEMKVLIAGIRRAAANTTLKEKLEKFEQDIKIREANTKTRTVFRNFKNAKQYSWLIAASLVLIFVTSIALFNINQAPSHQKIYAEYFSPYENYGTKRSIERSSQDQWEEALLYYNNGNYQKALDSFNQITTADYKKAEHSSLSQYNLYKGSTLMKLKKHVEAILLFEEIVKDDDAMIIQAKWYLSLCYLYENHSEKFVPLLEEIASTKTSSYSVKAQLILNKIQ